MTSRLASIASALNVLANLLARPVLAPIAAMPGWLSATLIACASGALLLLIFKYTSNQKAIQRVRNEIQANLFALKLFKDATPVVLAAQAAMIRGAFRLFLLSIVPILVMMVPVLLLLGQLSLWYQHRPLHVGEETVVALKLAGADGDPLPAVELEPTSAATVAIGPVRVPSKREVVWKLKAREPGSHMLTFHAGQQTVTKALAIGDGFMKVSPRRAGRDWYDILLNPAESPFPPSSMVQSAEVDYPDRPAWTSGTDYWVIYWFAVSMVAAFCARPFLNVKI
jgi:hypothetical protein